MEEDKYKEPPSASSLRSPSLSLEEPILGELELPSCYKKHLYAPFNDAVKQVFI